MKDEKYILGAAPLAHASMYIITKKYQDESVFVESGSYAVGSDGFRPFHPAIRSLIEKFPHHKKAINFLLTDRGRAEINFLAVCDTCNVIERIPDGCMFPPENCPDCGQKYLLRGHVADVLLLPETTDFIGSLKVHKNLPNCHHCFLYKSTKKESLCPFAKTCKQIF